MKDTDFNLAKNIKENNIVFNNDILKENQIKDGDI